ncbi:MAG: porin [Burkholderiales bacterium PBB6]|nr:MAG: porin [Burkholderiales bacterium PBB6]
MKTPLNSPLASAALAGLLMACGSAQSQSQPQQPSPMPPTNSLVIYGTIDAGVTSRQLAGEGKVRSVNSGLMTTSFLGVKGSQDLGDGYSGNFDLASFVRADVGGSGRSDSDMFWSKNAWVGMGTPWGQVRLGRQSSPNFIASLRFSPYGDSTALGPYLMHTYMPAPTQPMLTAHGATDSAWNNAVAYIAPAVSGVTVSLMAAPSEGGTAGRRLAGTVSYGAPGQPFAAVLSTERISSAAVLTPTRSTALPGALPPLAINDSQTLALGASYDFKVAKLFGQWDHTQIDATRAAAKPEVDLKTLQLGVSVPMGRGRVLLSAARTAKAMTAVVDEQRKTWSLGYDHELSRSTDVYAVVMRDQVSALPTGHTFALGARVRF